MKTSDFCWNREIGFSSEESLYLNKGRLQAILRTVNYFENGFLSSSEAQKIGRLMYAQTLRVEEIEEMILSRRLKRRIHTMADYVYDELRYCEPNEKEKINDELNINFNHICLSLQLLTFYSQGIVRRMSGIEADRELVKAYYRIVRELGLCDFLDECLREANKDYIKNEYIFDKEDYDEFSYTPAHEYALFDKILRRNIINTYSFDSKKHLINSLSNTIGTYDLNRQKYDPMNNVYNILKNTMIDISSSSIPLENKNKLVRALTNLASDTMFDEQKQLELMQSALVYHNNRRPVMKCNELFEKHKDKYKYKGVVYHGFVNTGTMYTVKNELKNYYTDGFISCSKDIKTASLFAGMDEYNDFYEHESHRAMTGYIIEILIDDEVEAIDLESLLVDMYNSSKATYRGLYKSYRKEKEVLLKLPIVSYRLLSPQEISKRLNESKDEEKWDKLGEENNKIQTF